MNGDPASTDAAPTSTPSVDAADLQGDVAVDVARWASLLAGVLAAEGVAGAASASLTFVDEAEIASLNRDHLGGEGPTDVLSFPIDGIEAPGDGPHRGADGPPQLVGDVVVCPAVAARNASVGGRTVEDEIALLVVHGGLHLVGHDHGDDAGRDAMWLRQAELLKGLHGVAPEPDGPDGGP